MSVDAPELPDLMCRVERLERQNRWLKRARLAVVVLLGSVVALGGAYARPVVPQKIMAHEFDVVDSAGKVPIRMYVSRNPTRDAAFDLFDGRCVNRVSV